MNNSSNKKLVAKGSVTQANMKISAVDGTAFIDFSSAGALTNYLGHLLRVRDSSGREIVGWIKAAGTGETYSADMAVNGGFDSDVHWTKQSGWTITGGVAVATNATATMIYQDGTKTVGALYVLGADIVVTSGGGFRFMLDGNQFPPSILNSGSTMAYRVATNVWQHGIYASASGVTGTIDNITVKQVLTPSASGVTITTTKGGTTYNFVSQNSSFNYNDSSGYTYEIWKSNANPVVATGTVNAYTGRAALDRTTSNAYAYISGVDLSPYQDGRHAIAFYDSNGYAAWGFISSTPPTGETLDVETVTNGNFSSWNGSSPDEIPTGWTRYHTAIAEVRYLTNDSNRLRIVAAQSFDMGLYQGSLIQPYQVGKCTFDWITTNSNGGLAVYTPEGGEEHFRYLTTASGVGLGPVSFYGNAAGYSAGIFFRGVGVNNDNIIDNISFRRVLDPPATGVRIVSSKNGTTRSWVYMHPNFSPGFLDLTYKIIYLGG